MATHSFRVHGARGVSETNQETPARSESTRRTRTIAHRVPVTEIMSRELVCATPDLPLARLLELVVRDHLGCVPVVDDEGRPVGMVTKLDIVEQLVGAQAQSAPRVEDVMMPLAITLDDKATVAHAAALMASEDMHHVMIVSNRRLIGVVSTMDITRWLYVNDGVPA